MKKTNCLLLKKDITAKDLVIKGIMKCGTISELSRMVKLSRLTLHKILNGENVNYSTTVKLLKFVEDEVQNG